MFHLNLLSTLLWKHLFEWLSEVPAGVVVIIVIEIDSTNPKLIFCAGSNPAHGVSQICDGENLLQCFRPEIRLKAFCHLNIPQKKN